MTEDEAKTKWCSEYQVATSGGDQSTFETDNRPMEHEQDADKKWHPTGRIHASARCIGSACMKWRWDDYEETDGYCGLAGRPPSGPQLAHKP